MTNKTFKVKITKVSGNSYWYYGLEGKEFTVENWTDTMYRMSDGTNLYDGTVYGIDKDDCEIIPDNI